MILQNKDNNLQITIDLILLLEIKIVIFLSFEQVIYMSNNRSIKS